MLPATVLQGASMEDKDATSGSTGAEAYARWLEHMQRSRTRHAAITRNLYTWSNYKSWADKMRVSWETDPSKR
jgi:hypothetical protein